LTIAFAALASSSDSTFNRADQRLAPFFPGFEPKHKHWQKGALFEIARALNAVDR
jgi:hypothetical protein